VESRKSVIEEKEIHKESIPRAEESHHKIDIKPGETITLTERDMPDIEEALSTVEALSDSFMAAHEKTPSINSKPQIRISVGGTDAIEASDASTASDPSLAEKEADDRIEPIDDEGIEAPEIDLLTESPPVELTTSVEVKEPEVEISIEDVIEEFVVDTEIAVEKDTESDISMQGSVTLEEATSKRVRPTPTHAVKPLVSAKAVILGEDGVGKHSLQEKADLKVETDDNDEELLFIRSNIIQLADFRVNLQVWSFDDAATMRIPRKEFYRDVDIIIVVYAVSDRWSFESVDFWLREAMVKNQETPPIVIVGNKKDIREAGDPDPLEPAVTSEEGFKFAEALSKRLGTENKLHPVAFIETSCLTGEGTIDVFKTASEFYTAML
ncbi:MAG: Rab family GTPase, partial [Candidatus Thorarchaeota archaeon]